MKFKLFFLIPIVFIFFNLSISQAIKRGTNQKVEDKKDQLIQLEKKKELLKTDKEKFLKLYITFYIKRLYNTSSSEFFKSPDYLTLLNEEERFKFVEKALIRKLIDVEKEEKATELAYNKILKEIKELERKKIKVKPVYAVSPLNGEPIELGNHILKAKGPLSIVAPIAGIIKGIGYKQGSIHIIIENERCKTAISGLDEVVVNVGETVLRNQIIGNIKGEKNLSFSVNCEKSLSSSSL
uniref:Peptidase M23 domain-containing protein n=1 Tax=Thermodesulfobacterium geofontis TaxID=1295609 RepID=A0A7V5XGT6_9BACT